MTEVSKTIRWIDANGWWAPRRRVYNLRLVLALVIAGVLYVTLVSVKTFPADAEIEVTPFTLAGNMLGAALYVGIANLMYLAGPLVETILNPSHVARYRSWSMALGTLLALLLPFAPVVALLLM